MTDCTLSLPSAHSINIESNSWVLYLVQRVFRWTPQKFKPFRTCLFSDVLRMSSHLLALQTFIDVSSRTTQN